MNSSSKHMFTNRQLLALIIPCMLEQLLNSLMGTADTIMVSRVGSAAISSASLVDSINILLIQVFSALSAGGSIICATYLGGRRPEKAKEAGRQLLFISAVISIFITAICLLFNQSLLTFIFGQVDSDIMQGAVTYFFYTALSFPAIAVFNACSAVMRSQENTREPMVISISSNIINIAGNAILIFVLHLGIAGAAIATLLSRLISAIIILVRIRRPAQTVYLDHFLFIRPNGKQILQILSIGIPSGIENSMFQLGKLAIQSTVSTLGAAAIAANAMTNILENLNGLLAIGIGIALMTVIGECIGAGKKDEAVYYIKKVTVIAEIVIIFSCTAVYLCTPAVTRIGDMEAQSAALCISMVGFISITKPFFWTLSFIPAYGMRAAGDVKFSMLVSCLTMWLCRYSISVLCMRVLHLGPVGVWYGMASDWCVRAIIFSIRFHSRKWLHYQVAK